MPLKAIPVRNRLLASLSADVLASLMPRFTKVQLLLKQTLLRENTVVDFVYFPLDGMLSLVSNFEDGGQAEVGIIGREGMVGAALLVGLEQSFNEVNVQMPGSAFRMPARDFHQAADGSKAFRTAVLRFNEALHIQVGQTAACNGAHLLEHRLARWLLMALDRSDSDELPLTQEFMGVMLGVARPSITTCARILQQAGIIRYTRGGRVTVLDRAGLEDAACECYRVVRTRVALLA